VYSFSHGAELPQTGGTRSVASDAPTRARRSVPLHGAQFRRLFTKWGISGHGGGQDLDRITGFSGLFLTADDSDETDNCRLRALTRHPPLRHTDPAPAKRKPPCCASVSRPRTIWLPQPPKFLFTEVRKEREDFPNHRFPRAAQPQSQWWHRRPACALRMLEKNR
jgi:hypothetical protein